MGIFQELKGVEQIVSGYAGGRVENPTYQQVCTGSTGHAEVAQITYDPETISYEDVLYVFWRTHDPTTPNRLPLPDGRGIMLMRAYMDEVVYNSRGNEVRMVKRITSSQSRQAG